MVTEIGGAAVTLAYNDAQVRTGVKGTAGAIQSAMSSALRDVESDLARVQAAATTSAVASEKASARVARAKAAEADAAGKVRVAEAQLADVRSKANASTGQLARAEENLAAAQRRAKGAADETSKANAAAKIAADKHKTALAGVEAATSKVAAEQSKAGAGWGKFGTDAEGGLAKAYKATDGLRAKVGEVGKSLVAMGSVAIGGGAVAGLSKIIDMASDAEQSVGAVEAIFKDQSKAIDAAANSASSAVGLSANAYRELASVTGAMLKNKGIDDYTGKTQELLKLGADLAAQFGGTTKDAVEALNATMRGENDPIEKYGVSLNDTAIKAEALSAGIVKATKDQNAIQIAQIKAETAQRKYNEAVKKYGANSQQAQTAQAAMLSTQNALGKAMAGKVPELTAEQKAQAALSLITKQTADAQGTFARESDTAQHKVQVLKATIADQATALGAQLLPAFVGVLGALGQVTFGVTEFAKAWSAADGQVTADGFIGYVQTLAGALRGIFDLVVGGQFGPALANIFHLDQNSTIVTTVQSIRQGIIDTGTAVGQWITGTAIPALQQFGGWLGSNAGTIGLVASMIGGAVLAWKAYQGVMTAIGVVQQLWAARTLIMTAAQTALNIAMSANPIGLVVIAIGALVGALAYLWTTNDGFRNAVIGAWDAIKGAFSAAGSFIGGVFTAIGGWFVSIWNTVSGWGANVAGVFRTVAGVISGWWTNNVLPILMAGVNFYRAVYGPIFTWLGSVISVVWYNIKTVISNAWLVISGVLSIAWAWIRTVFGAVWGWLANVVSTAWGGIKGAISSAWSFIAGVLQELWSRIRNFYGPIFTWLYNSVVVPAWNGIRNAISGAWSFISGVFGKTISYVKGPFGAVWNWLSSHVSSIWHGISSTISTVWDKIKGVFAALGGYIKNNVVAQFKAGVDLIGKAWDGLKALVKAPVEFAVQTVINQGLIKGYNAVVGTFGGTEAKYIPWPPPGWATGGYTGPGAKYQPAGIVHAGEYVIRKESTRRIMRERPGLLESLNKRGDVPGYARGGWAKPWPMAVGAYVKKTFPGLRGMGGYGSRPGPSDHGSGNAIDFMVPDSSPVGDAIANWGIQNHDALKLKYIIWKKQIIGSGRWGAGWRNYTRYDGTNNRTLMHYDHPHFSFVHDVMGDTSVLARGLSAEALDALKKAAGSMAGAVLNPIDAIASKVGDLLKKMPGADTAFGKVVAGFPGKLVDAAREFVAAKLGEMGGTASEDGASDAFGPMPPGGPVARWRSTVVAALTRAGLPTSTAYVEAWLRQISSESGGNPGIAQKIHDVNGTGASAGVGLVQVIPGTFAAYRDKSLPNDRRNPLANLVAGMRYAKSRYGSKLLRVIGHGHGYSEGGLVEDEGGADVPGYAYGGKVRGRSPHKRADNIRANLTAGEYVHEVDTARYYGDDVMDALNARRVPIEALAGYAKGGKVVRSTAKASSKRTTTTKAITTKATTTTPAVKPVQVPVVPVWPANVAKLIRDDLTRLIAGGATEAQESEITAPITAAYNKIRDTFSGAVADRKASAEKLSAANKRVAEAEQALAAKIKKTTITQRNAVATATKNLDKAKAAEAKAGGKQNAAKTEAARNIAAARAELKKAKATKVTGKSRATQQANLAKKNKAVAAATKKVTAAEAKLKKVGGSDALAKAHERVLAAQEKLTAAQRKGVDYTAQVKALTKARDAQKKAAAANAANEAKAKASARVSAILTSYEPQAKKLAQALNNVRENLSWTAPDGTVVTGMAALKEHLAGLRKGAADMAAEVKSAVLNKATLSALWTREDTGTLGIAGSGPAVVIAQMKELISRTKAYAALVAQLKSRGLNATMLDQLRSAGLDGYEIAQGLADASPDVLAQLNDLQAQLGQAAGAMGSQFASDVYDSQIAAADSVMKAWTAKEAAILKQQRDLGVKMRAELDAAIAGKPSPAAVKKTIIKAPVLAKETAGQKAATLAAATPSTLVVVDSDGALIGRMQVEATSAVSTQLSKVASAAKVRAGVGK